MYSSDNSVDKHRHCFLLKGSINEVLSDFLRLCEHFSTPLICAHDVAQYDQLNLPSLRKSLFRTCSFKQARQELGQTNDAVLIDLTQGVSASALAILSGTVRGNGVFAIALPNKNWLSIVDQDLPRYLPWPFESEQIESNFKFFLLNHLHRDTSPFKTINSYAKQQNQTPSKRAKIQALPALDLIEENAPLTKEQAEAQSCLFEKKAKSYVLIAPRGRGKSTLLGDSLARMLQAGKKVALTAPNQSAIQTLRNRFEHVLKEAFLDSEAILNPELPFFAPDALLANDTHWDMLFVDEASMIPVPLLVALNKKAEHCLFSTTDYGYEGAGKGFGIRFYRYLEAQSTQKTLSVQSLTLSLPIRWGGNDPLENWINDCFFLTPNQELETSRIHSDNLVKSHTYKAITGAEWLTQPDLLSRTFQLLVNAHYQTSPDNLRWILDDPSVYAYLSLQGSTVNSVAIVTEEGQLPDELSRAVLQGTRRPRGHLIPQSLLAHEGIEDAGQYRYWRISRIATQESKQNKGLASQLLNHIETVAKRSFVRNNTMKDHSIQDTAPCDFLSTSFAATTEVIAFWLKNGFIPVRLGTTKDQASGCYSLMMIKPLSKIAQKKASIWHQDYLANLAINLSRDYKDIDTELAEALNNNASDKRELGNIFTEKDRNDLTLFMDHHRPYLTVRAQLTRLVRQAIAHKTLIASNRNYLLLNTVISQSTGEIDFTAFGLKTKKQVEKHLKLVVNELLKEK
jgi:tRNA(Met) cytidine acetyltransferase